MTVLFDLTGRTALVTGAGQGIGFAIAEALAAAGASVVLHGRSRGKLDQAAEQLRDTGATIATALFDVTDAKAVPQAADALEGGGMAIDILVNNAGVQRRRGLDELDHDDRHEVMRTNVDSVFYVSQTVARHMIARTRQSHQHRQGSKRTRAPDHGAVCGVEGSRQEPDASWAPIGRRWGCR